MDQKKPRLNLIIMTVYESKDHPGIWKAFCAPYAITTQADSSREAKKKIEALVVLYEEGLKKYEYPASLMYKKLSDSEDKKVLQIVWHEIQKKLTAETNKTKDFTKFAKQSRNGQIKVKNTVASFYQPQFA